MLLRMFGKIMEIKETGLAPSRSNHTRLYSRCLILSILSLALFLAGVGLSGCGGYTTANTQSTSGSKTLSASPASLSFGNVSVGATATQSVTLKNTGTAAVSVSQTSVSGSAFSITKGTPLYSIAAGQSVTLQIRFAPSSSGGSSGTLTVTSDADNSPTAITLTGTGVAPFAQLTVMPNNVNFGNVAVGVSSSLGVILKNSGNSNVTVSGVTTSGGDYSATGVSSNKTIAPGQFATLNVVFTPAATGKASGSVSVASNATNSPATISLLGSGVVPATPAPGMPICGISGDTSIHVPTDWQTFVPPAKGQSYVDPTFGCTVTRVTDASSEEWSSRCNGSGCYTPMIMGYATISSFNANDSYLMLEDGWNDHFVTDLKGDVVVRVGNMLGGNDGWYLGDAINPSVFYYTSGNTMMKGTISGSTVSTAAVHQFSEYAAINFMDKTDLSQDGRHVAVVGGDTSGGSPENVFVYNFAAGTKGPVYTTGCAGSVSSPNNGCLHGVTMTPDNNVMIDFAGDGSGLEQGNRLWAGSALVPLQDATNHLDMGYDMLGNAVYIEVGNSAVLPGLTNPCPSGWGLDVRQINNPLLAVCLLDNQPSWHVGYRGNANQPWVGLSFFDTRNPSPEWFDKTSNYVAPSGSDGLLYEDEIVVVRIDANNNSNLAYRLARAYSRSNEDFYAQPHAAISRDGKYVAFNSNMAYAHTGCPANFQTSTGCTDVYIISLLEKAAAALPAITAQPVSQTVTAGQTATFSVAASGTAPLSYQWQKNGANISGATSGSYTTPATTSSDNGTTFDVVVSNSAGTVTSNTATLTVN